MSGDPGDQPPEEEVKKPTKILVELTIPTSDTVVEAIQNLFPTVKVKIIEQQEPT